MRMHADFGEEIAGGTLPETGNVEVWNAQYLAIALPTRILPVRHQWKRPFELK